MSNRTSVPHTPDSSRVEAGPIAEALSRCLDVLAHRPNAIISDIDGTISHIVPRPEDATVEPAISHALEVLATKLDLVAVITARDETTARGMVGASGITYVGNYGLVPGTEVDGVASVRAARTEVEAALADMPCVQVEDKGVGFSLHYRNCPSPGAARLQLLELVAPIATRAGARILEGKKVIELVPGGLPDKRSAFTHLLQVHGIRGLIYLGDDLSDIAVFDEIARRRAGGALDGLAIAVADGETEPSVFEGAGCVLGSVDQVAELLEALSAVRLGSGDAAHA